MKKLLAFTTVAFDTLYFQAGTTIHAGQRFKLYGDYRDRNDDDVTRQEEEQILRWILSSSASDVFFHELGITANPFVALSVGHPVIERGHFQPGDIDILICDRNRADLAIGIQCKRVKGPCRETFKEIYEFPRRESLHPDVGIIFLKVTQPTGKSFDQMSDIGMCVDKDAARLEQTAQLTNRIADYMRLVKRSIDD
jgi:hypothetical protein